MQLTNSLVSICCNNILSNVGGDIYISVMTIVSSVRQLVETPIHAMNEGTSPILSYNYGARRPSRVRKAMMVMGAMMLGYTAIMWSIIIVFPNALIGIFSSDATLMKDAVPALKQYFAAFIFMDCQYIGQTVFKSLNKKKQAIFFSLLRKVFIVVPLTYLMPYALHMGTDGVFLARTSIKRHWRWALLCRNAVHSLARIKENGTIKKMRNGRILYSSTILSFLFAVRK